MKIGFIVSHPTQFEVPFFRYIKNNDRVNQFHVFYLEQHSEWRRDKETGLFIHWGINLYKGYPYQVLPTAHPAAAHQSDFLNNFDLFIINGYKNDFYRWADEIKRAGIPIVLRLDTVLLNQSPLETMLRKLLLKASYHPFSGFLVTGTAAKQYLSKLAVPGEKIGLFSYCTDPSFFKKTSSLPALFPGAFQPGRFRVILVVAKLIRREDPQEVIEAFGKLNDRNLLLVIAGDGKLRPKLEHFAKRFSHLNILFTGYIPYRELPGFYSSSALFIHPAKKEPWGVSVQEAIGCGCRVICSDKVGSAYDLIVPGKNGFLYRSGNSTELAARIRECLNVADDIVERTNKKILEKWNYPVMWQHILALAATLDLKRSS